MTPRDNEVVQVVLRDLLSYGGEDSPIDGPFGPTKPLRIADAPSDYAISVDTVLFRVVEESWKVLTADQERASREAAEDLARRVHTAGGTFQVTVDDIEIVHVDPAPPQVFEYEWPIKLFLPGYSSGGTVAVVRLDIPWSIHSVGATYVLQEHDRSWSVLIRQFAYYL